VILVGVFAAPIPSGRPAACVFLQAPGPFHAGPVPDGTYHLFAAGVPLPGVGSLLSDDVLRAAAGPVVVRGGAAREEAALALRPPSPIDPPILVSLPVLLAERAAPGPAA
jgi:hypothetical protein